MITKNNSTATLTTSYIKDSKCYTIYFKVNGGTQARTLFEPIFEITGSKMKKRILCLAKQLERYGITPKDIEQSIIEACNDVKREPPKYLR